MAEKKKRNWIKSAVKPARKGLFAAKAKDAGETTKQFAAEKSDAPGKLGKEARLASTLMGMSKGGGKKKLRHFYDKGS